ncbi:hypothetical protein [Emcibacter sp.]|uniref:hypothetical protein n=1 Tax=Emcibacter sp. TaxID=1979954 RepID=UPI002AA6AC5C|nr:hypothetical protein [Emcibacter sp.]
MTRRAVKGTLTLITVLTAFHSPSFGGGLSVSFSRDLAPLLRRKCAVCHLTGKEAGGLALHPKAAWKSLVNHPSSESHFLIVEPGAPEKSYLLMKLEGTHIDNGGSGAQMPFSAPPLDQDTINMFRTWIEDGATNN